MKKIIKSKNLTKTGIEDLDNILGGGIPSGHTVLLAGSSGTGKTILAQEFLFNGTKFNEKGIYMCLVKTRESAERIIQDFKFYDKKAVDSGLITFLTLKEISELKQPAFPREGVDPNLILSVMRENIEINGAKRVVIDTITGVCQAIPKEHIREFIYAMQSMLSFFGCTTILISDIPPMEFVYSVFGIEEFISDGIILLMEYPTKTEILRTLQVIKMRGVNHSRTKHIMKITPDGIKLTPMMEE